MEAPRVDGNPGGYRNFFLTQLSSISERIVTIAKAAFDYRVLIAGAAFAGALSVVLLFPEIPLSGAITLTLLGLASLACGIALIVLKVLDQGEIQSRLNESDLILRNVLPKINQVKVELNSMIKDNYDSNAEIDGYERRCFELLDGLKQEIIQELGEDFPGHETLTQLVARAQVYRDDSHAIRNNPRYTIEMGGRIFKERLNPNILQLQGIYTRLHRYAFGLRT